MFRSVLALAISSFCLVMPTAVVAQTPPAPKAAQKKPGARAPLTQADVQKLWTAADDTTLSNRLKLYGVAFPVEEEFIAKLAQGGVTPAKMPISTNYLRGQIEESPDLAAVSAAAPALLTKVRDAAQKRDVDALAKLLHPELLKDKAKIYDLFDVANYRGHDLGHYSSESNHEVSVQFFQLTTSNVERVHYVYFSKVKGTVLVRDVKSGNEEAKRFLSDEEPVAQSKLQLMFRALNDGDDAGVKTLCTDGLYQAIKEWGGDKHPGDRLTRGHNLDQVTVKTDVPLDQKSVRVVAQISYPLANGQPLTFFADFERIGSDLKVVRIRDTDNRMIVFDPNMDNYLNRRYGLPDVPLIIASVPMTDQGPFIVIAQLRGRVQRAMEDHDAQRIKELAQTFIDSDPSGGEGFGYRVVADQLLGNDQDAEKDVSQALQHGGTAYLVAQRHAAWHNDPFTPALLAVSRTKIEYIPAPGKGSPENIDLGSTKAKWDKAVFKLKVARPFLALTFKGPDGKNKTYNFAAFGTTCQTDPSASSNLVQVDGGGVCDGGTTPGSIPFSGGGGAPIYVPRNWHEDLMAVMRAIEEAQQHGR